MNRDWGLETGNWGEKAAATPVSSFLTPYTQRLRL